MCNVYCTVHSMIKSVHDFNYTDSHAELFSIRFQCYMLESLVQHSFKIIFISVEPVVDHCWKRVGKRVENIKEIRAYIKVHTKLGHLVKQIFTDLGKVYGSHNISYKSFHRWRKNFQTGTESVKDAIK